MFTKKITLRSAGATLVGIVLLTAQPLRAQSASDTERIEKLERAVQLLEKQNEDLKAEVNSLKKHPASASAIGAEGPTKTEVVYDGKSYIEKSVPVEKSAADKWKLSTSITELELFGDLRLRYEYRGGRFPNHFQFGQDNQNDWQERERERYRLRIGLRGTVLDDWFFGIRLETGAGPR